MQGIITYKRMINAGNYNIQNNKVYARNYNIRNKMALQKELYWNNCSKNWGNWTLEWLKIEITIISSLRTHYALYWFYLKQIYCLYIILVLSKVKISFEIYIMLLY